MATDKTNKTTAVNALQMDGETLSDESTVTALQKDSSGNVLLASGTSVPGDTTAFTYAKGCQFILTNADTSVSAMYENVGSTTAPTFVPSGGYSVTRTALTTQNIYDLHAFPTEVIPAQGAGSLIIVEDYTFKAECGTIPFTVGKDVEHPRPYLAYGTSTPRGGVAITNGIESVMTAKSETRYTIQKGTNVWGDQTFVSADGLEPVRYLANVLNTPVVICSTTTGYDTAASNGSAVVTVRYRVIYP